MSATPQTCGIDYGAALLHRADAGSAVILEGHVNDLLWFDDRVMYAPAIISAAHARDRRVAAIWSNQGGRQERGPDGEDGPPLLPLRMPAADTPPGQAIRELLDQLRRLQQPAVLIYDYADLELHDAPGAVAISAQDHQLLFEELATFPVDRTLSQHRLVVISRGGGLDSRLGRFPGWEILRIELPDESARHRLAERAITRRGARLEDGFTVDDFAVVSGGLALDDIMRLAQTAVAANRPITRREIQALKAGRIRQRHIEGLDVPPPGKGWQGVAGLSQVLSFLRARQRLGRFPRAIILAGPPGVGKTHSVSAIGDFLGWPVVALANVRSMWLGESERRIRDVLSTVRSMAPCVLHIDEVDQVIGQRETGASGDSGTGARILAELWQFLGDAADIRVLAVLTTNRPDLLEPPTLSRSEVIPVLHPTPSEQMRLLQLAVEQEGRTVSSDVAAEALQRSGIALFSGRMLVRVGQRAAIEAGPEAAELTRDHLRVAFEKLLERVDEVEDERMALKALSLTSFEDYLPWVAASELSQPVEFLPYVQPLLDEGRLNRERLIQRISKLDEEAAGRRFARSA